jgi:predicted nucleic acid-binding protein
LTAVYFDSAYLAKLYLDDSDSGKVRDLLRKVELVSSSSLCIAEVSCALHRSVREKSITRDEAFHLRATFFEDVAVGILRLIPVSETILRVVDATVSKLPPTVFLRAGDAVHLASAQQSGFAEIWTNDRHLLKAAPHFGIMGSSV